MTRKNPHAVALGRRGGKAGKGVKASPKKRRAVAANGRLGGRPRKDGKPPIPRKKKRASRTPIARRAAAPTETIPILDRASSSDSEPHAVGTDAPADENDPMGRFHQLDQPAGTDDPPTE